MSSPVKPGYAAWPTTTPSAPRASFVKGATSVTMRSTSCASTTGRATRACPRPPRPSPGKCFTPVARPARARPCRNIIPESTTSSAWNPKQRPSRTTAPVPGCARSSTGARSTSKPRSRAARPMRYAFSCTRSVPAAAHAAAEAHGRPEKRADADPRCRLPGRRRGEAPAKRALSAPPAAKQLERAI